MEMSGINQKDLGKSPSVDSRWGNWRCFKIIMNNNKKESKEIELLCRVNKDKVIFRFSSGKKPRVLPCMISSAKDL